MRESIDLSTPTGRRKCCICYCLKEKYGRVSLGVRDAIKKENLGGRKTNDPQVKNKK